MLEGDYILPSLASRAADGAGEGQVRAVFLYEPDEAALIRNYLGREPEAGEQVKRARVSWLYGQWLKEECERLGLPALPARPWETLHERILSVI